MKYNSTKSNVMVFCCNLLKDIPVPNFMLNGVPIDKVHKCVMVQLPLGIVAKIMCCIQQCFSKNYLSA